MHKNKRIFDSKICPRKLHTRQRHSMNLIGCRKWVLKMKQFFCGLFSRVTFEIFLNDQGWKQSFVVVIYEWKLLNSLTPNRELRKFLRYYAIYQISVFPDTGHTFCAYAWELMLIEIFIEGRCRIVNIFGWGSSEGLSLLIYQFFRVRFQYRFSTYVFHNYVINNGSFLLLLLPKSINL